MTGAEAIESFLVHYDLKTSFSAQGFTEDEILLFLNNAQDQFVKDKAFGENFQPPAFEDNQKRVVDILPLVQVNAIDQGLISFSNLTYGAQATVTKVSSPPVRWLYTVALEIQVRRVNPLMEAQYVQCKRIKTKDVGKFIASEINRTHFLYPKYIEHNANYTVFFDMYTTSVYAARVTFILIPYPITAVIGDYNQSYSTNNMNLHPSVHQEVVDMAVAAALQTSGDKRYQTKTKEDQLNTN